MTEKSKHSVARGAGRMGLATLISRILGLVREQVFAFLFGASAAADAFNIAFRIPNLLRDLFAEGAMSAAFVPNFTRVLMQSRKRAYELLAAVLVILLVGISAISILGMIYSRELVEIYASAFHSIPGKFELSVGLTRVMFPFFPLVAMAAVVMGALNALGFFFLPAFAPVLFNVASILSGLIVCPLLATHTTIPPIYGMAFGVVIGGFLQFYVQWIQIRREGLQFSEVSNAVAHPLKVPEVKQVLWLLIPGTIGLAATQLGILINSIYATSAGPSAVSWLNYAFRLMQFPIGIFGVSFAVATLPQVARLLASGEKEKAATQVGDSLSLTFAVNGPAAAGLMAVGLPIVQLLFEHGKFEFADSQATSAAVFWYAVGLPGYSIVKVLVPIFYALGSTRIPVILSFLMVGLNATLNHVFLNILHYPFWSVALATSITSSLNAIALAVLLNRKLPNILNLKLGRALTLETLLSLIVGGGAYKTIEFLSLRSEDLLRFFHFKVLLWGFEVALAIGVGITLWWAVGSILKVEEVLKISNFISKKLRRTD